MDKSSELPFYGRRMFIVFAAVVVVALAIAVGGLAWSFRSLDRASVQDRLELAEQLFLARLEAEEEKMQVAIAGLMRDARLAEPFLGRQRAVMLGVIEPSYNHFSNAHGVTHLYVTAPDGTNFLRAHEPGRHGDRIERQSQLEAERSGAPSTGIEVGPLGTMTLRVVMPWRWQGRLIGFIEMGAEVSTIVESMPGPGEVDFGVFVSKAGLDRSAWLDGQDDSGRALRWDRYAAYVEAYPDDGLGLPDSALFEPPGLGIHGFAGQPMGIVEVGNSIWALRWLPLLDPLGAAVGKVALTLDVTAAQAWSLRRGLLLSLGVLLLGGVLLWTLWLTRRRVEAEAGRTNRARQQALAELEELVAERTAALQGANLSLTESEAQLRIVADSLPVLIVYLDAQQRYGFVNRTCCTWFNQPAEEILGRSMSEFHRPSSYEAIRPHIERVLSGQPDEFEATVPYPDGVTRDIHVIYVPHRDVDGKVLGFFSLAEDVTERRATEVQLRRAQKMEAIGQLTGGIAHDFNNLLAVILGNADILAERFRGDGEVMELLSPTIGAAERGARLSQQLLAFARRQPLQAETIDLRRLAHGMGGLLRRSLGEAIELRIIESPELWTCRADPGQVEQALLNLAINARDAMPDGGSLTIEMDNAHFDDEDEAGLDLAPGDYVVLAITDSGRGIPAEIEQRIFDPFFTTKAEGQGSGLGLSMVYGFARQSGGQITVYSEAGEGTTFRLYLPRSQAAAEKPIAARRKAVPPGRGETILVVEDEPDVRALALSILAGLGYRAIAAADGASALEAFAEASRVDLLLTDVGLPGGMNGRELAEALCRKAPELKVLYMSGYTEDALTRSGKLDDGVTLLQKPFRKAALARKLREVLDASAISVRLS